MHASLQVKAGDLEDVMVEGWFGTEAQQIGCCRRDTRTNRLKDSQKMSAVSMALIPSNIHTFFQTGCFTVPTFS